MEIERLTERTEEKKILEKIAEISEEFLQAAGIKLNYQKITDDILYISGAKYASFELYDRSGNKFRTVAFSAPERIIKKIYTFLGFKLIGREWSLYPDLAEKIKSHTITHFAALSELLAEIIPKPVISIMEKTLDSGEVVFVKILKDDLMIGDFTLVMPRNIKFKNENYVEIFTRQVGQLIMRKRAEDAVLESEEKYSKAFQTSPYAITIVSAKTGKFIEVNDAFISNTGFTVEDLNASPINTVNLWVDKKNQKLMLSTLKNGIEIKNKEFQFRKKNGEIITGLFSAQIIKINNESFILSSISDITKRKKEEDEILHLSYHDKLTGLYNRRFVEEEIIRLNTNRQLPMSIIMGDLNSLKLANDTFGHSTGDKIIKETAGLLKKICRSDDILARWGGDEFVIILPKTSVAYSENIVQRIKNDCTKLIIQKIPLSLSIGTATKIEKKQDINKIIIEAENNMYKNKLAQKESNASSIISALEQALFEKSSETMEHTNRIKDNAIKLGKLIKLHSSQLDELKLLASLHDIGKVAISEKILLKEGKLIEEEWLAMKRHLEIGFNIAQSSPQIVHVAKFILACHENWDGSGYPRGLKGEAIPIISRIILIADAYDVMITGRIYKNSMSKTEAIKELKRCAGTQFDPVLVEKFIKVIST